MKDKSLENCKKEVVCKNTDGLLFRFAMSHPIAANKKIRRDEESPRIEVYLCKFYYREAAEGAVFMFPSE